MFQKLSLLVFLLLSMPLSMAMAQGVGEAVEVQQPAQIVSGGATRTLTQGSHIVSGDEIRTGASGKVQILFPDETKIVVGANSSLRIDETLFRKNGTARKFATTALGGSFRFISGNSPKQVYKLATPLATMGIRGTAFDYTVTRGASTDLLVFEGLVRFCARDRRCALVPGGCQAVTILRDGTFTQPLDEEEKRALLLQRFPLLADQANLRPPFRAGTGGCQSVKLISLPGAVGDHAPGLRPPQNPADGPSDSPGNDGNPAD